ncbi:hypothetical protein PanWU01x14_053020 [Parasponia andersonii]|uniref:Uncharacterized protein n=1 Tax=Parasponia andersonii TaxID=3476 RepID=A0A2P5DLB9_PARAD|nr:hypothetical protein PanWU01x14_053020 [Parasponia andersonii]
MAWCSHCLVESETQLSNEFVCCSRCGKVLDVALALPNFYVRSLKRSKRNKKNTTRGLTNSAINKLE